MPTRRLEFFMLPHEFHDFTNEVLTPLSLWLLDHLGNVVPDQRCPCGEVGLFYIAPAKAPPSASGRIQPGREGWLSLMFPAPTFDTLFKAQLGAKSEWRDDAGEGRDNPKVISLFTTVAGPLRRRLLIGTNVTGSAGIPRVTTIRCSRGVTAWVGDGNKLRQAGVRNLQFHPIENA